MAVYSCNYPIYHTFNSSSDEQITYNITIGTTRIYQGKILPYDSSSSTVQVDLSEIFREYLETYYENIEVQSISYNLVPQSGLFSSFHIFIVSSSFNNSGNDEYYRVVYDYNTDYVSEYPDIRLLNDPIDNHVDPRQLLFITGHNLTPGVTSQYYQYEIGDYNDTLSVPSGSSSRFQYLGIDLSELPTTSGQSIFMSMQNVGTLTYVVDDSCKNRFVLYYVNKYGGFDSILMSGRQIESWNPDTTSVRLYNDRGNRKDWEQKKIHQEIDHLFELNTGLLTNEGAAKIDHLIYSPKILLHDLDNNTITSVLITDTNYSVKQWPYELVQYTITVKESQKQIRR